MVPNETHPAPTSAKYSNTGKLDTVLYLGETPNFLTPAAPKLVAVHVIDVVSFGFSPVKSVVTIPICPSIRIVKPNVKAPTFIPTPLVVKAKSRLVSIGIPASHI